MSKPKKSSKFHYLPLLTTITSSSSQSPPLSDSLTTISSSFSSSFTSSSHSSCSVLSMLGEAEAAFLPFLLPLDFDFFASFSFLKHTISLLSIRQALVSMWRSCTAFLGLSRTWEQSSLCLKTSIPRSACTLSANIEIFSILLLMCWEWGEFESMRPWASHLSLLVWLRVLGVDGWGTKKGGRVGRVIFVIVPREHF